MGFRILMVLALVAAFAVPLIFGMGDGAMIASQLCILATALAIFFGTLNLNNKAGPK